MTDPTGLRLSGLARRHLAKFADTTATHTLIEAIEMIYRQEDETSDMKRLGSSFRLPELTIAQLEALQAKWDTSISDTLTVVLDRWAREPSP